MYRQATAEDRNYITKTLTMVWASSKKNEQRSKATLEKKIEELFTGNEKFGPATIVINCEEDDPKHIKGFIVYHQINPKQCIIHALFTRPHYRRNGMASLFLLRLRKVGIESVCFTLDLCDDGLFMPVVNSMFQTTVSVRHLWANDRFSKGEDNGVSAKV
jgi:hypothetical protein